MVKVCCEEDVCCENSDVENHISSVSIQKHNGDSDIVMGEGACRRCSCPGFFAARGYECHRSGCGHHRDEHW
ncbi:MAG: hypothetical protein L3V56_00140 [Candidatus Magnetoovum sp. WYHC-5]|nr:hypothetical protein [Candidatus Magnetoovum sp. WYHC-5]